MQKNVSTIIFGDLEKIQKKKKRRVEDGFERYYGEIIILWQMHEHKKIMRKFKVIRERDRENKKGGNLWRITLSYDKKVGWYTTEKQKIKK